MSHCYRKIKYTREAGYGTEDEFYIYMHQNNTSDYVSFYDEGFNFIFGYGDTTSKPLDIQIMKLWTKDIDNCPEIERWTKEDHEKLKLK